MTEHYIMWASGARYLQIELIASVAPALQALEETETRVRRLIDEANDHALAVARWEDDGGPA